ncbi:hypothetical protein HMI55_002405 [Coelomomyces lativittatus]|nr:hypothetical protein HMI56_006607 [Coelomomyces lativittatus]KAJ1516380.1 hypothetical protein HMI55_002405 [Coelomomyces lativittatus]
MKIFGPFSEVVVISPSSTSLNPTASSPSIKPFYHMRILGFLNNIDPIYEDEILVSPAQSSLSCLDELLLIVKDVENKSKRSLHDFLKKYTSFLKSKKIRRKLSFSKTTEVKEVADFFSHTFSELIYKIPHEHIEMKNDLLNFFVSLPDFFKELKKALDTINLYNSVLKLRTLKSTFAKRIYFELHLQPNGNFFFEWGPVFNSQLYNGKLQELKDVRKKKFLKTLFDFMESFSVFQGNYISYMFHQMWSEICTYGHR